MFVLVKVADFTQHYILQVYCILQSKLWMGKKTMLLFVLSPPRFLPVSTGEVGVHVGKYFSTDYICTKS